MNDFKLELYYSTIRTIKILKNTSLTNINFPKCTIFKFVY